MPTRKHARRAKRPLARCHGNWFDTSKATQACEQASKQTLTSRPASKHWLLSSKAARKQAKELLRVQLSAMRCALERERT
eukprot:349946-Chlamydomonas_euryale.AAC.6